MHVVQMVDSLGIGGAQKLIVTFAATAEARGIPVTVVSLDSDHRSPIPEQLTALGAQVHHFPARRLRDPKRLVHVVRFMRRARADVLQTHLIAANIVGGIAGRLSGTPVVGTLHSAGHDATRHYRARFNTETLALRYGAQVVVGVGRVVADVHQERFPRRPIAVVANAVELVEPLSSDDRLAARRELAGDCSQSILIAVGRLVAAKGYADLVEAFAMLVRDDCHASLAIVGDGPLRSQLEAKIVRSGLERNIRLLGARDDVSRLLAASDMLVMASHWEGLPLAVLEGMAAGLPVVATDVGDISGVVTDGTGIIVPPRDPPRLANAMRALIDDPERRESCGREARMTARQCFSPSAWMDQLLDVYVDAGRQQTTERDVRRRQA